MEHYGQLDAGSTIYIYFTTHAQTGAAIAPSTAFEAADARIYKNGSDTQRTSEAGYTMTSPFDTVVGLHLLSVDLSDNTHAGFYASGSRYTVILAPDETVDGLAVVRVLADFTIGPVAATISDKTGYALTSGERDSIAAAHLDLADGIETGLTVRQAQRLQTAAAAGKLSGAATTTVVIRNAVADSKNRITATVDADGNRSAITTILT